MQSQNLIFPSAACHLLEWWTMVSEWRRMARSEWRSRVRLEADICRLDDVCCSIIVHARQRLMLHHGCLIVAWLALLLLLVVVRRCCLAASPSARYMGLNLTLVNELQVGIPHAHTLMEAKCFRRRCGVMNGMHPIDDG